MNVEPDEGVEGGDGAAAPDQGGELVQDPLHLGAQDQEAARLLGEVESRVSWRLRSFFCQIVFQHCSYWPGVRRCWEDLCLEESILSEARRIPFSQKQPPAHHASLF